MIPFILIKRRLSYSGQSIPLPFRGGLGRGVAVNHTGGMRGSLAVGFHRVTIEQCR